MIRTGASRNIDRNAEERCIAHAPSEVVSARAVTRREVRGFYQVGTVRPAGPHTGLLNSGEHGEGSPTRHGRDVEELPAGGHRFTQRAQESYSFQGQKFDQAQRKRMRDIECGWTFLRTRVPGVLRQRLQDDPRRSKKTA